MLASSVSTLRKRLRLEKNIEKVEKDIVTLNFGGWPPGTKPFRVHVEVPQLDDQADSAKLQEWSLASQDGRTWKEVKCFLHTKYITVNKLIDFEMMKKASRGFGFFAKL